MEENKEKIPQGVAENNKEILSDVKSFKTQETYTLPSKGLAYKPDENIPSAITLRRMTSKEEKIRLRNDNDTEIMRDLLQACIMNEKVNAEDLKLVDANYLLFRLRSISLMDDTYKVSIRCPNCSGTFVHKLNLSEVPIKYLDEEAMKNLVVKLPMSGQTVTLKIVSLHDVIFSGKQLEEFFNEFHNVDKLSEITTRYQLMQIDMVDNQKLMLEEKQEWFESLDILDYRALKKEIENISTLFGFETDIKTICPNCKHEVTHGLPITDELFNPSND